ncbi:MAG: N-acetylmuramoyl-L-alanine amidase [Bacteroidetes bacterium]|nr:N-acetylmuramoyl-L-alanine amidase [Bacteroidota bacterium]
MMLSAAITFLLKSALCSALFLGYYWFFLRNRKLNQYNRIFLLSATAFSLVIPLLHFEFHTVANPLQPALKLMEVTAGKFNEQEVTGGSAATFSKDQWIIGLYLVVSMVLLAIMLVHITRLYKAKLRYKTSRMDGFNLVSTDLSNAPFSFMRDLFWRNDIAMESKEGQQILKHELAHIRQMHSLDKIGMQLVTSIFWLNPCFWLIQKELSQIHEFIADEAAINDNDTEAFALMLLQTHYGNTFRDVTHPFFYSPIKRRLLMLHQKKKSKYNNLRKLLVVPVLVGSIILFSFKVSNTAINRCHSKVIVAVDAAHGGQDKGALGAGGIMEKDLSLRIANRLTEIAGEYNIQVVPIRMSDAYIPLPERAEMANEAAANYFVSIHVNKTAEPGQDNSQYEMVLDERNPKYDESRVLAAAISARLSRQHISTQLRQTHLAVLKGTTMPAMAIECGYIDNNKHLEIIQNDEELDILCRNILNGIADYQNSRY